MQVRSLSYYILMPTDIGVDESYVISNETLCKEPSREGDAHNPGIRMTIEKCDDLEELLKCFSYVKTGDGENPHFLQHYKRALCGKDTPWKLTAVRLDHRFMWMIFQNQELYEKHCDNDNADMEDADLPDYQECINFELSDGRKIRAEFTFEIKHPGIGEPETTIVSFSCSGPTVITEVSANRQRSLFLPDREIILAEGEPRQLVYVTECYQ